MRTFLLFIFFVLLSIHTISAQFAEQDFEKYTVKGGLSDNNIYGIIQNNDGYIWVGTEHGLNSFNGTTFTHYYSRSKPLFLASTNIQRLIPFTNNYVGIIGRIGFQAINTKNLSSDNYRFPDTSFFSNYNNAIYDAIELPDKSVLLSSTTGIYVFDKPGHIKFRYDSYTSADPENKRKIYGRDIVVINNNEALIYTDNYKLDHYNFIKNELTHIDSSSQAWKTFYPNKYHGTNCKRIAENQFILFNMYSDSITFYDRARNIVVTSKPSCMRTKDINWAGVVTMISDSTFVINWPVTGYYLFKLDKKTGVITSNDEKFLPSYKCNTIFVDKEKRLWVGTRTGLLRQKKKSQFLHSVMLFNNNEPGFNARFQCVYRFKDRLYVGSYNRYEGLFVVDTASMHIIKKVTFYGGDNAWSEITSIQRYHKDTLWVGTGKGLLWLNVNNYQYGCVKNNKGDSVLSGGEPIICPVQKSGKAWLFDFMNGKAGFYDTIKRTFTFYTNNSIPSLPFERIKHIVYDSYGDVWLAGHALARWNHSSQSFDTLINVYAGPNKFKDDIIAITADQRGSLWLYNAENVLLEYKIKEKKFYEHGSEEGLPLYVQSMADEVNDRLWFTTGNQLICYTLSTKKIFSFDQDDGLPVERASSRSISFDKQRNCYYSLHNNYLAIFPAILPFSNEEKNRLLISEIAFADTSFYNPIGTLQLNYTQQSFSVHFNVLDYEEPLSYQFFYCIDNKDWINLEGQQVIFFNQVASGKRHIRIKAISKSGQQLIAEIFLKIPPPVWKKWWFTLCMCLVAIIILYSVYKYRVNQLIKLQTVRNNIARDLHDDIASTIAGINIYSEVAFDKIQNKQEIMAEEILQKIGHVSRLMIERMSDIVWSISSKNDYLLSLADRMKGFCTMTLTPLGIHFTFDMNDAFTNNKLSMEKRKNMYLIFKEAIYNTVKYADCKRVAVTISVQKNHVSMIIEDDGKGFDINNLKIQNGNGLRNLKERAAEISGTLHIFSEINQGTRIELNLSETTAFGNKFYHQ